MAAVLIAGWLLSLGMAGANAAENPAFPLKAGADDRRVVGQKGKAFLDDAEMVRTIRKTLIRKEAEESPGEGEAKGFQGPTRLSIRGSRFTLNENPTFLLGISYYGALGAAAGSRRHDLTEIRRWGFNWIRVWATWAAFGNDVSVVDREGHPRTKFMRRLQELVAECDRQGLVVDVTLSRGNGVTGPSRLQTLKAHRRAVVAITTALKPYGNWYLDLANERNVRDQRFVTFADLKALRQVVREVDPKRLVTASHAGDITKDELGDYLRTAGVDFISPHRPRQPASPRQTQTQTGRYLAAMKILGKAVPVLYQEPFRRGFASWQPKAVDYLTDVRGARAGGAAGWCFHNGDQRRQADSKPRRCFDLRKSGVFDQLDAEERKVLKSLKKTR